MKANISTNEYWPVYEIDLLKDEPHPDDPDVIDAYDAEVDVALLSRYNNAKTEWRAVQRVLAEKLHGPAPELP